MWRCKWTNSACDILEPYGPNQNHRKRTLLTLFPSSVHSTAETIYAKKSSEKSLKKFTPALEITATFGDTLLRSVEGKKESFFNKFFSFKTLPCSWLEAKSFDRNYIVKGTLAEVFNDRPSLEADENPVVPLFLQSVQRNCYTRQSVGFYFFILSPPGLYSTFTTSLRSETPLSSNASIAKLYFCRVVNARTSNLGRWSPHTW